MKKLSELSMEELKSLYDKNQDFQNFINERVYEDAMSAQEEEFDLMGAEVFDYHDHYNSFYLTVPKENGIASPEKIAGALDVDYLNIEYLHLYKKLCELNNIMENREVWNIDCKEYEEMEELAEKLADGITEQLRAYEEIQDEQIKAELEMIHDGFYSYDMETDGEKVFYTTVKIMK